LAWAEAGRDQATGERLTGISAPQSLERATRLRTTETC
jgi:hypothetical protein